jgi:N utilization substance protein B
LRLGVYESLFTQTPGPVVINEAVELAKRYGTAHSAQFVNGVLDKFFQQHRKDKSGGDGDAATK